MNPYTQQLLQNIQKQKKKLNAVILSHVYQNPEIQDIADFTGDSLGLCLKAAKTQAEVIVFCGVHFMAESAKILNPSKTVLLPELSAGCPMADMADAAAVAEVKKKKNYTVVSYVNTTAAVKAISDVCCTSSNAVKVVQSIPRDQSILFVPDKNLGSYVQEKTGRSMMLWEGYCPTHQRILPEHIQQLKQVYPKAWVAVHPECRKETRDQADFIGSTEQIFEALCASDKQHFIVGTESGILHRLKKARPDAVFLLASDNAVCPNMKKITLEKLFLCMENQTGKIELEESLLKAAFIPLQRMMEIV